MHNEFTYETRSYSPSFKSGIISDIKREVKLHKSKSSPQHLGSEACTAALLSLSPKNTCLGSQNPFCVLTSSLENEERTREFNNWAALLSCPQQRKPGLQWDLVQNLPEMGPFSKHQDRWKSLLTNLDRMSFVSCRSLGNEECN